MDVWSHLETVLMNLFQLITQWSMENMFVQSVMKGIIGIINGLSVTNVMQKLLIAENVTRIKQL